MVNDILKVNVHGGSHTSLVINELIKLMSFLRIKLVKIKWQYTINKNITLCIFK